MNKEEQIPKIIDYLYDELVSSEGKRDCFWYSEKYALKDIMEVMKTYNLRLKKPLWCEFNGGNYVRYGLRDQQIAVTDDYLAYETHGQYHEDYEVFLKN